MPPLDVGTAVSVIAVARRDIVPAVQGAGTVEAKVVVQLSSKITGRIVALLAFVALPLRVNVVLVLAGAAALAILYALSARRPPRLPCFSRPS